jgi:hypothetical protein
VQEEQPSNVTKSAAGAHEASTDVVAQLSVLRTSQPPTLVGQCDHARTLRIVADASEAPLAKAAADVTYQRSCDPSYQSHVPPVVLKTGRVERCNPVLAKTAVTADAPRM